MNRFKDWLVRFSPPPALLLMVMLIAWYFAFLIGFLLGWKPQN